MDEPAGARNEPFHGDESGPGHPRGVTTGPAAPIVVDVDGTPSGRAAVDWALEEAGRRGAAVRILPRRVPERLLAELGDASMIVVGSASFLAMSDLAGGSTAMYLAVHAGVPVVVLRPDLPDSGSGPSAGRVVVGTDGTVLSVAAVDFAVAEARDRGCGVTVVHAIEREEDRASARAMLADVVAGIHEAQAVVALGMASHVLIDESAGARLLVVGSRGYAGLGGMLAGSVSQAVVHRARCPVAVVRAPAG